jgi:hypothetical protein
MLAVRREKVAIIREFQGTAIKVFNLGVFLFIYRLIETVIGRVMGSIFLAEMSSVCSLGLVLTADFSDLF